MENARITNIATLVVIVTGSLWGIYWLPVRQIAELGVSGAWGTLAIVGTATVLLSPLAWQRRRDLMQAAPLGLLSLALGGVAFVLYSIGILYGRVAIIVILFFLTPVWSTLIGRFVMGWPIGRMRVFALVAGGAGLVLMLGANGEIPVPRGLGEWLGLAAGFLWAVATVGIRVKVTTGPAENTFVFAAGALLGGLILSPLFGPMPDFGNLADPVVVLIWVVLTGGLWWALSLSLLMWAVTRLEPARVGILLMGEVLVSALTAAVFAGEQLALPEILGGALVVLAGVLEVLPARRIKPARQGAP